MTVEENFHTRFSLHLHEAHDVLTQHVHVQLFFHKVKCPGLYLGQIQYVGNQLQQQVIVFFNNRHILPFFLHVPGLSHQTGETDNRIQRRTYLMTHIGKEGTLQTIGGFCLLFGFNQHSFRLLQFRNIIVDSYQFYLSVLRFKQIDDHIGTYPIPFPLLARTLNTHLSLKMFGFTHTGLTEEIEHPSAVAGVHLAIYPHNICQLGILVLSHILIPLLDGIAFPVEQVQLGITYLRIIRYKQEEILEITDTAHGINPFRIVDVNHGIAGKVTFTVIHLAHFRIKMYHILRLFGSGVIPFSPVESIIQAKVDHILSLYTFCQLGGHIRVLE